MTGTLSKVGAGKTVTRIQPDDLYRTLAEATLDKVYIVDRNGVVLHANTSAAQCFSTKPAELVGKSLSVLCPPEKSEKYLKSIREVFETGRPLAIGLSDALHGNEVGEQSFLSPVKNKKGRIAAVLVTSSGDGRDARAAEALRESGMLYQDLANNPSAGVYRIRVRHLSPWSAPEAPPYVYEFVNDRYCELTGIPAEKHYSDPTVTLRQIHPDEYENWAALNERANRTGEPFFWEGRVVVKGQLRWFHYESRSRSLPNGDLLWTGILLDITERKQLESAVELIAKKYSTVFDNVSDGMWIIDLRGRIVEVNDSYCRMSGYRRSELIGMHIKKLEGLESAAAIAAHMKKIIECGQDRFETRHRRKDGSHIALEVVTLSMALEGGRIAMLARDITKRKRAEEELRNSEQRYRGTLNLLGDMIHVVDAGLNVVLANQVLRQLNRRLGLREDFIGENLFKVYPFLTAKVRREYEKVIATGEPLVTEELNRIAGAEFSTETRKIPIFEGGRVKQVLTVMRDVSERLRAQKNQERLQGEILSALTRQQIMIGQTLHDSLGQLLTGISYMVKGLEHDLKRGKPPAAKETARILECINNGISQTKSLSHMLYPAELEEEGLVPTLKNLAGQTAVIYNVACSLKVNGKVSRKNDIVSMHLYRIVQESIHNAIRHGRASRIKILLTSRSSEVEVRVADNGKGFDPQKTEGGLGLKILQYRAKEIGGNLAIRKNVPQGTVVVCRFFSHGGKRGTK